MGLHGDNQTGEAVGQDQFGLSLGPSYFPRKNS
jgi:hypothetical protein